MGIKSNIPEKKSPLPALGLTFGCGLSLLVCAVGIVLALLVGRNLSPFLQGAKTPDLVSAQTPVKLEDGGQGALLAQSQTSSSGDVVFTDPLNSRTIKVTVVDARSSKPLEHIKVTLASTNSVLMILSEAPERKFYSTLMIVPYERSMNPAMLINYHAIPARQSLGQVEILMDLIDKLEFSKSSIDLLDTSSEWVKTLTRTWRYDELCLTGKQLADMIEISSTVALLPVKKIAEAKAGQLGREMGLIIDSFDLMGSEVLRDHLESKYAQPVRFRFYRWPWDHIKTLLTNKALYEVVPGSCSTPTTLAQRSVTPTSTPSPNPTWVARELYIQLQALITRANVAQREALRTLNTRVMEQDSTGAELQRNVNWISDLKSKGLYIVATQERLTFLSFKQSDATHVDIEAFEVWSNQVYSNSGQLVYSGPPCDLPQTYHLQKFNDRWLITKIDFHNQCFYEP